MNQFYFEPFLCHVRCLPPERCLLHWFTVGVLGKTGTLATRPGVTWLVPLAPTTQPSDARPCPLTASDCIDLAWHGLEATASLSSVQPGQVWFGGWWQPPEVEVYQEVITTLQYTHCTGLGQKHNRNIGILMVASWNFSGYLGLRFWTTIEDNQRWWWDDKCQRSSILWLLNQVWVC